MSRQSNFSTFKIWLSWRFPRKTAFLDDFPLCRQWPPPPPLKNANSIFIVISPSLTWELFFVESSRAWARGSERIVSAWPRLQNQILVLKKFRNGVWNRWWNAQKPFPQRNLGNGRNTVSRVLFRRREITEPHWVLGQTRWVRFGTQIIGWEELTEFSPRNSVSPKKLTEFGVWNRTPRNRIRPVSENRRNRKPEPLEPFHARTLSEPWPFCFTAASET